MTKVSLEKMQKNESIGGVRQESSESVDKPCNENLEIPLGKFAISRSSNHGTLLNNLKIAFEFSERMIRSSLGPYSRDKLIVQGNLQGNIMVTNDGRTLMEQMFKLKSMNENKEQHPIHTLLYHLSKNQDTTIGDGTTSVVVLCGELCKMTMELIEKWDIDVDSIARGYNKTCDYVMREWLSIFDINSTLPNRKDKASRFINLGKMNCTNEIEIELIVARSVQVIFGEVNV